MSNKYYYSLELLRKSTSNDEDFLQLMIKTFIETNRKSIDELKVAIENNNFKLIGEICHKMQSSYKHLNVSFVIPILEELAQYIYSDGNMEEATSYFNIIDDVSTHIFSELNTYIKQN